MRLAVVPYGLRKRVAVGSATWSVHAHEGKARNTV
jgi:hypothetical protein